MATPEERQKILEMVASGALKAGEAAELLSGSDVERAPGARMPVAGASAAEASASGMSKAEPDKAPSKARSDPSGMPRWLKIRVGDLESGRGKVSVNIPLRLMQFGLQVGRGFVPELEKVDCDALSAALAESERGLLVDVQDEEDGERVRIYVE